MYQVAFEQYRIYVLLYKVFSVSCKGFPLNCAFKACINFIVKAWFIIHYIHNYMYNFTTNNLPSSSNMITSVVQGV